MECENENSSLAYGVPPRGVLLDVTLRDLLLERLFNLERSNGSQWPRSTANARMPLTLDTPLYSAENDYFTKIMDGIQTSQHPLPSVTLCLACNLPRFTDASGRDQNTYLMQIVRKNNPLHDFHQISRMLNCRHREICKECLSTAVATTISNHWWEERESWLRCPVSACRGRTPRLQIHDVLDFIAAAGRNAEILDQQFEGARQLRTTLHEKIHGLSIMPRDIRKSMDLHQHLASNGFMWELIPKIRLKNPKLPELRIVDIEWSKERSTPTPFFTHHLSPRNPRECTVCATTWEEFEPGDPERWARATEAFKGNWKWQIFDFPRSELLPQCRHTFDICRSCISTYIDGEITSLGRRVVGHIMCPTIECRHKFTHAEVRHLATPEVLSKYDRFDIINTLSALPNFRWCLREDCPSGGIYEGPLTSMESVQRPESENENHITCTDCEFSMCYSCQTPWHDDLTCEEYASQREHGDPQFEVTQKWIKANTKRCPGKGCGVLVRKGAGCFHMTCSWCQYQFCWECLASWDDVEELGPEGHGKGCYFGSDSVGDPTELQGTTISRALRRWGVNVALDVSDEDESSEEDDGNR
ncbi:hypothetical protein HD806DRAFT_527323 [Xylariaceae sp. AK1471]|nr:hypothetical protein HD806DRAFT_527323 [Xylariaceae sp. AK1471]